MRWIGKLLQELGLRASGSALAGPPPLRRVLNLTRSTELADRLEVAGESSARTKGLLGRTGLAAGAGLWILPCEGIHTFWMKFALDLVYLDRRHRVCKVRSAVGPWRISLCLTAHSVLELPAGTVYQSRTERGDQLEIALVANDAEPAELDAGRQP